MSFPPSGLILRAAAAVLALAVTVLMASVWLLLPPLQDLALLGAFLLASGAGAICIGFFLLFLTQIRLFRSVRVRLLLVPLSVVAVAMANIWFVARLMFISAHDLTLLFLVLIFALGVSTVLVYLLSESLRKSITLLYNGVQAMMGGDLQAHVDIPSGDELSDLAAAFNHMAARTNTAFQRQKELEDARREMVIAVSHDLRTPLASIRAIVESINDGVVQEPETVKRYLTTLEAEVDRLGRLIDDLFELAQLDAGTLRLHLEKMSIGDLISDLLQGMGPQAEQRRLHLTGRVEDEALTVLADPQRLHRVLLNLIQNALHHTPADGTVFVQAREQAGQVQVEVSDTGEGIAPGELELVFQRFYQADRARSRPASGAGLGLSIAKGIVEAHGGRIWVHSSQGQGSTFAFTLPKAPS